MTSLYRAAIAYLVLGLGAGLFYREFTKINDFPEGQFTQLGVTHTHLLTLGFIMFLIFLALEKVFEISRNQKLFTSFFWLYNLGVILTTAMMVWHGILTVKGEEPTAMISGIAGLGHIFITIALALFVTALGRAIKAAR
ncbi:Protein of uncharacterised function (DUF2871) [Corynebacterium imitans]|uniref:Protein of uncharacterized function (DUF2871) n=1 Tax=Corynebacterium imitans TaxID=156978 RepID=A0A076NFB6_9CORY|nr:DUF2871 domain-containing protein [Corynebacterium imitans]AIJ33144.1 hypothetical protein CIMIT_03790 [Corynebacterium imitans]SNV63615.1 Protein of uncharacterised function (DUF2871) [Corynebacterium imitans]